MLRLFLATSGQEVCVCVCVFACSVEETQDLATSGLPTSLHNVCRGQKKRAQRQAEKESVEQEEEEEEERLAYTINETRAQ
jgi:hypothetical protein